MNLNYDKLKHKQGGGENQWTSYSDLFMALSVVFLFLYVVASLRSGTHSIASRSELAQTQQENENLKKQLKVYEVLKEDYLKQDAQKEDVAVYKEVMDKLGLLEDQAREKRAEAVKQAEEAKQKERELNQYQALVKSIVNANMLAQSKVRNRDLVIQEKAVEIESKTRELEDLTQTVQTKQDAIEQNNQRIRNIQDELKRQIKEVEQAYAAKQRTKEKAQAEIARLRQQSQQNIEQLQTQNNQVANQLKDAENKIAEKNRETERLLATLSEQEKQYQRSIEDAKRAHEAAMAQEKRAFQQSLAQQQLSAAQKAAQERAHREAMEQKAQAYAQQMSQLNQQLTNTQGEIKQMEQKYQGSMQAMGKANEALKKSLAESLEKQNAQRKLAQQIKDNFAKAGLKADVNPGTGDVIIHFGGEYFDNDRADLKPAMRQTLEKMMPVYAKSLFQDPKVAQKIGSVEIVGFASPTYQGKFVNPNSLDPKDRQAVNYNMDLSYRRAKSIFEHTFDPNKMSFEHQRALLPKVKVTGRSYLATEKLLGRNLSSVQSDAYCQQFDCRQSQRVIIKFNLSDSQETPQ